MKMRLIPCLLITPFGDGKLLPLFMGSAQTHRETHGPCVLTHQSEQNKNIELQSTVA